MKKIERKCGTCGAQILRYPINHNTGRSIDVSFCDNKCKGDWQRENQKPDGVTRDWLIQKYEVEKLDCAEIGRMVGRDTKRVWEWLRDYGVKTRPRGSELAKQWARGDRVHPGGFPLSKEARQKIREARIRDGRVPYLTKDGKHYMKGRRGPAHHSWRGGLTPEREAMVSSEEWKDAVKAVWFRSNAKCERCGKDHRGVKDRKKEAFDIHHVVSFQYRPLRTVVNNLALLCEPCHYWVHSRKNINREFLKETPND